MKVNLKISILISLLLSLSSCKDDDPVLIKNVNPVDYQINDFIWKAMNSWYLWQNEISNLNDNKIHNSYEEFIAAQNNHDDFFNSLLKKEDKFSWIVDDYNELLASFQGENTSFGFNFSLQYIDNTETKIRGIISYIIPNSPAEKAGLKRGDIFLKVDNQELNNNNFRSLLNKNSANYSFKITDYNGNYTDKEIGLTKVNIKENPVFYSNVITENSNKIGYLVYNQFITNYDDQLNNVFADFKSQGINDLVLDLRYNLGGDLDSAIYLSSMITGQFTGQVHTSLIFNNKKSKYNETYVFPNKLGSGTNINSLNLSRVFVLVTGSTASASECVINSLLPYIQVVTIGEKTVGKTVGSTTLTDSPSNDFLSQNDMKKVNKNHTWAIQPIIFKFVNKNNRSDFETGFVPNHVIDELQYNTLIPLGNKNEPLLAKSIDLIANTNYFKQARNNRFYSKNKINYNNKSIQNLNINLKNK